jgi:hypothetical protein
MTTANITYTSLPDGAGTIAGSAITAIVDMSGTPTSKRVTLGQIGNLILSGAGGDLVVANSATTAGTVTTSAQPNITTVGTLSGLVVAGSVAASSVQATTVQATSLVGSLTTASQMGITTIGDLTNLTVVGNVNAGNVNGAFYGSGAGLTGVAGSGISGAVANATYSNAAGLASSVLGINVNGQVGSANTAVFAGTVTANAQPNITSTGTLTGLTVNGLTALGAAGNITILGGTTGQVLSTDGSGNLSWAVGGGGTATSIDGANVTGTVANATYAISSGSTSSVTVANVSGLQTILAGKAALPGSVTYTTAIPMNAVSTYMASHTVTSATTFTVGAGAIQGATTFLRLIADGTNAPVFTGFRQWGGSLGYDNRSGYLNVIQFWYDGYDYWYSVAQAMNAVPESGATVPGAPTIGTATAGANSATITFTAPGSNGGATITGYTATSSPGSFTGTLAQAGSGTITVNGLTAGTPYTFTVTATNSVGTGSASAASNSITPTSVVYPRLTALSSFTEAGTGPYTYTSTALSFGTTGGVLIQALQSGVDGSFAVTNVNGTEFILGLQTGATPVTAFATHPVSLWTGISNYSVFTTGVAGTVTNTLSHLAGDIMRLRRVGSSVIAEVARSATPSTFTTIYTWTGVSTGVLYFVINPANVSAAVSGLTAVGLA